MRAASGGLSRRDVRTKLFAGDDNRRFFVNGEEVILDPNGDFVTVGQAGRVCLTVLTHGLLKIDLESRECFVAGDLIDLTRIEFEILHTLMCKPKLVWDRKTIIESVWGRGWYGDTHIVDVHVSSLRRKLDPTDHLRYVVTCRGVGFQMSKM